jgi:hypothetical protein
MPCGLVCINCTRDISQRQRKEGPLDKAEQPLRNYGVDLIVGLVAHSCRCHESLRLRFLTSVAGKL